MRQVFLDTETTGLYPDAGHRIVELGCVELLNRRHSGRTLHFYLNPGRANDPEAVGIHGLTDEFLADKPLFESVVEEFIAFVADAEIIAHNAAFDLAFLDHELRRAGRPGLREHVRDVTDSLAMARELYPGKANSLDALCRRLEVDNSGRSLHGALLDARLLAEVYIRMTRGQESLVIEVGDGPGDDRADGAIDLSRLALRVVLADAVEAAAHEAVLLQIDKASGGRTGWRRLAVDAAADPAAVDPATPEPVA